MATETTCQVPRTPRALAVPTYSDAALTPEELAEFINSLEYDEPPGRSRGLHRLRPGVMVDSVPLPLRQVRNEIS